MTADRIPVAGQRWLFAKLWHTPSPRRSAVIVDEVTDDGVVKHHSEQTGRPLDDRDVASFVAAYTIDPDQPASVRPLVRPPATGAPESPVELPHDNPGDGELPLAVPA